MYEYAYHTNDWELLGKFPTAVKQSIDYVEKNNMINGLASGADWRDTMEKELANKLLLTNNVLLVRAYKLKGESEKAENLKQRILSQFVCDGLFVDYLPDGIRPDPLGLALGVLYDVIPAEMYELVMKQFESVDTDCGVTIKYIHNPYSPGEQEVFAETDGEVVWPFVVGFTVMALIKMGYHIYAREMFQKIEQLDGFYEWYDPRDGKGYGAPEQLWSAALYLRALHTLRIGE